jgi:hypothetical protein
MMRAKAYCEGCARESGCDCDDNDEHDDDKDVRNDEKHNVEKGRIWKGAISSGPQNDKEDTV